MKISVIGCGYLGTVHAATLASMGHQVVGIDSDVDKIRALQMGKAPFHEPGLDQLLTEALAAGNLRFSSISESADVHFICVGTPQSKTSLDADLTQIYDAVDALAPFLSNGALVVGKSTVPVGTAKALQTRVAARGAIVAWNPEFLRQGTAVKDSLEPERLIYGVPEGELGDLVTMMLDAVYSPLLKAGVPRLRNSLETAELSKVAANAFLAMKLSFINAVSELCEQTGADVVELAGALGLDSRIGSKFLNAGAGFGGGCLPKDLRSFRAQAQTHGAESLDELLSLVDAINADARYRVVQKAEDLCGGTLKGRKITILGASFKAGTDDIRDSPALDVAVQLAAAGAAVTVTDPQACRNAWMRFPQLNVVPVLEEAVDGAELTILMTEWEQYTELDPSEMGVLVERKVIIDGRNALNGDAYTADGWSYQGMGTSTALTTSTASTGTAHRKPVKA